MGIVRIINGRAKRETKGQTAQGEADRLVEIWGEDAYDVARSLWLRESAGLLHVAEPGFWARVARAVGHQLGVPERAAVGTNLLVI